MKQPNKDHQRLEGTVVQKLKAGWNCFTREEVEALMALLHGCRRAKTALYQRIHTAHGDAIGWTLDGDIGLHERRPAPEGAINLFHKPPRLDFVRGWRVPEGVRINGFKRTDDGRLVQLRRRDPQSPNDLMRQMHQALQDLSYAYRKFQETPCSESEESQ